MHRYSLVQRDLFEKVLDGETLKTLPLSDYLRFISDSEILK